MYLNSWHQVSCSLGLCVFRQTVKSMSSLLTSSSPVQCTSLATFQMLDRITDMHVWKIKKTPNIMALSEWYTLF